MALGRGLGELLGEIESAYETNNITDKNEILEIDVNNIEPNPYQPRKIFNEEKIKELDAPQLPRVLDEVDAAIINTNYALSADLNPLKDAIILESKDSPYANIVVVKKGNEEKEYIKALNEVLNSKEVKEFIATKYQGSIVEAF